MDGYGTAFRRAAWLGVLASLACAAPASADWVEPATGPLNDPAAPVLYAPSVAGDATTTYAAIEQPEPKGIALNVLQRQGSSPWQPVGATVVTGGLVGPPQIADVTGRVYVAWTEQASPAIQGSPGRNEVFVDYLSGSSWLRQALGRSI